MDIKYILQFLINGLIKGSLFSIAAFGFALVYNTTRIFHIAYAGIYTVGAYMFYMFISMNFPIGIAMLLGVAIASLLGYTVERTVYRPLFNKKFPPPIFIISSIGTMAVLINLLAIFWGNNTILISTQVSNVFDINGLLISNVQVIQLVISLLILAFILWLVSGTRAGIVLRAFRDNIQLTGIFGIDILRMRTYIFVFSSFLAGLTGCLISYDVGMDPYVGMDILLVGIVAFIVGGAGNFIGVLWGGFLVGILDALTASQLNEKWSETTVLIALVIVLLLKPQGLMGKKHREV